MDSYFVRLSNQKSIYFTETEADTVILGHMKINKVQNSAEISKPMCFDVINAQTAVFTLCAEDQAVADEWICKVK